MADEKQKLGRDVFIALAAIGWADGNLDSDEADAIVRCALEEGHDIDTITEIEAATKEPVSIEAIDLSGMSKADRLFVYAVGSWITRVDGNVAPEEKEALEQLGVALKIPEAPRNHAAALAEEVGKVGESDQPAFYNLPMLRKTLKARLAEAQALRAAEKADEADDEASDDDAGATEDEAADANAEDDTEDGDEDDDEDDD